MKLDTYRCRCKAFILTLLLCAGAGELLASASESASTTLTFPLPYNILTGLKTTGSAGSATVHTLLAADNPSANVGVGTINPKVKLDVNGILKPGSFIDDAAAEASLGGVPVPKGSLYYNTTIDKFRGFQGLSWVDIGGDGGGPTMLLNRQLLISYTQPILNGDMLTWTTISTPTLNAYAGRTVILRIYCSEAHVSIRRVGSIDSQDPFSGTLWESADCSAGNNDERWSPPMHVTLDSSADFQMTFNRSDPPSYGVHIFLLGYY